MITTNMVVLDSGNTIKISRKRIIWPYKWKSSKGAFSLWNRGIRKYYALFVIMPSCL